ncbi:hypothetical protein DYB32_002615 [Aphanomyces invadans]|uniref:Uncharacterized protein n=1 Tax=Aphanomyces invadans TaxID=157072 RepID=A0A3R6YCP9_9STRA|nr:hypothetical protein DYB32_002615 [Aphanomyces invadans]
MSLTVPQPIHDALDDTSLEPFIPVSQLPPLAAPSATPSVPSIATTSPQSSVEDLPAATPTHDGCHGGAWVFSPPAQPPSRKPSARKSSVSSFFCFANTPTEASQHEKDQNDRRRLQRLHQIPENDAFSSSRRRRRRKTPLILLGSVLLFGVVATVLLVSKGDSSNANLGDMVNATAAPRGMPDAIDNTQTPANASLPNNPAETPIGVDEDVYGWGRGDGTNVRWSKYRFYFVNKCSFPLHLYQKYRDDSRNWSFCQVPVGSYGCPNNRDGAYLHTPHAGHDQATCKCIGVASAHGVL